MKLRFQVALLALITLGYMHSKASQRPSEFVNPMIGTGGHGHTFPGPTRPFGMVQLSPDNKSIASEWDWSSGYHISDTTIVGFSHTHLSGTGVGDLGDILLMPFIGKNPFPENNTATYASGFSHDNEKASAGYYAVFLNKPGVKAELTATEHVGFHRYTFPKSKDSKIVIDLLHKIYYGNTDEAQIDFENDSTISGYKIMGSSWQSHRRIYFSIKLSKPFSATLTTGDKISSNENLDNYALGNTFFRHRGLKSAISFQTDANEQILVKVAISMVSVKNAKENMKEISDWNFDKTVAESKKIWDDALAKIQVEGTQKQKEIFYTALYHSMIAPNEIADSNGEYMGPDYNVHTSPTGKYYSTFSLWDTYRGAHPLYTLLVPKKDADMVSSMMQHYQYNGYLPIWTLWGSENHCMIANHSIPVMVDAILKGLYNKDLDKVLEAMVQSSTKDHPQSPWQRTNYEKLGYYPYEMEHESISKTLESAYNDWCVAQLALKIGNKEVYQRFSKRAMNYKNLFHPGLQLMVPKDKNGNWNADFNPAKLGSGHVTEGNSWQYTWSVQHDPQGLIALFGSKQSFITKLDSTFNENNRPKNQVLDVSGLIGQYAHGNEPSHHVAYLYNYAGQPWRTQFMIAKILKEQYNNTPDGLSGNEDCGQMSAWYVLNAMGFYPLNPASGNYDFGSPLFPKTEMTVGNNKTFSVLAPKVSEKNIYIQSIKWNGKPYNKLYISYANIMQGGTLEFEMGPKPQKKLAGYQFPLE